MKDTILAISGKPGLYRLVSQGRNMLIVESLDAARKRFPAGARDRVTSLNDVSMYTDSEDKPLMEVFGAICRKHDGAAVTLDYKKATTAELFDFLAEVLPEFDRDRVYGTDIKKLIQWYNILVEAGLTDFTDEESEKEEAAPQGQ